jgi:O-antigen/teichoic acid export membrane protein
VVGFAIHGLIRHDIGIAFEYWMVAVPIVILGAPFGAYFASKAKRDHIIGLLLFLIGLELVTTLILVPFSPTAILVTVIAVLLCIVWFWTMLHFRHRIITVYSQRAAQREAAEPTG